jgi:RNA polymerase sigma factor (TIGR02999 family)
MLDPSQVAGTVTALVHEAYLRLVDVDKGQHWNSRGHFFGAAAEAMRRIPVDKARWKQRLAHGGEYQRVDLDEACTIAHERLDDVLIVDEALRKLTAESPEKAELVKLRYFAGMTLPEAAEALGVCRRCSE